MLCVKPQEVAKIKEYLEGRANSMGIAKGREWGKRRNPQ